jgi:hypothetical protein
MAGKAGTPRESRSWPDTRPVETRGAASVGWFATPAAILTQWRRCLDLRSLALLPLCTFAILIAAVHTLLRVDQFGGQLEALAHLTGRRDVVITEITNRGGRLKAVLSAARVHKIVKHALGVRLLAAIEGGLHATGLAWLVFCTNEATDPVREVGGQV